MKKLFTIHRHDSDGTTNYVDEATTRPKAERIARDKFAKRLDRDSEIAIREEREILRLRPGKVGFRGE